MTSVPPGRLIPIGDHRLHLHCAGSGTPTIILDAALGASSLSWSLVQPGISEVTRCCAYDRAGFGWSEAGPLPRTADCIADELYLLLKNAAVPPPYVLVGHSFGGLVVRLFAARHPEVVAGLVLIEPAIPADWVDPSPERRLLIVRGTRLCRYGGMAARTGLARTVTALVSGGALGAARVLVRIISRGGLRRADEEILSPIWKLPPEARSVLQTTWTQPKFFEALGSQIEHIASSAALVMREADTDLGDLPVAVLTGAAADEARLRADAALAARSRRGRHVLVPDTGHWIPLDAPRAVIDAIAAIVREIRNGSHS